MKSKLLTSTKKNSTRTLLSEEYRACLLSAKHGLERESARVDGKSQLASTPHPKSLGSSLTHPLIKTDFAEAQIEYATNVHKSIPDALRELTELHAFTASRLGSEYLWPFSMPPVLPTENKIEVGNYGTSIEGRKKTIYRNGLGHRYGKKMQTISGVHYNISFDTCMLSVVSEKRFKKPLAPTTKSQIYFDTIRNFYRISPALLYLFGSSSLTDVTFTEESKQIKKRDSKTLKSDFATTLRLSSIGYTSKVQGKYPISVNSLEEYASDMCQVVSKSYTPYKAFNGKPTNQLNDHILQLENEYYSLVRPKQVPKGDERVVDALVERGVEYLEIRLLDLDPFSAIGVEENRLYFLHMVLLYCMLNESPKADLVEMADWRKNQEVTTWFGRKEETKIKFLGEEMNLRDLTYQLFVEIQPIADLLDDNDANGPYSKAWESLWEKWNDPSQLGSTMSELDLEIHKSSFRDFGLTLAKLHKEELLNYPLPPNLVKYYEDLSEQSIYEQQKIENLEGSNLKKNQKPIQIKPLKLCSGV
ncbi:glutamate--cysteine ligase [Leptospira noumeaensis]|uniref:Glutamate--cysteine ligase n=1 Tax=Leptospira noumeaensis TaxID=2484964 RepID=A0A4R9I0E4_9LEPT|nr:glutamate--cysteine ligase [Leptospira noumeaensis]TGK78338.1 glutamate--cysteine ligase [Leptospira noumeaensis]